MPNLGVGSRSSAGSVLLIAEKGHLVTPCRAPEILTVTTSVRIRPWTDNHRQTHAGRLRSWMAPRPVRSLNRNLRVIQRQDLPNP